MVYVLLGPYILYMYCVVICMHDSLDNVIE